MDKPLSANIYIVMTYSIRNMTFIYYRQPIYNTSVKRKKALCETYQHVGGLVLCYIGSTGRVCSMAEQ